MTLMSPRKRWPDYGTVWRWHFYAGLLCIPFILWLACTGSIYLWRPQIEAMIDRSYAEVTVSTRRAPARDIAHIAESAVPGSVLHRYQLPDTATQAVQVIVGNGAHETRVYVHPATLGILHVVDEDERLMPTISRLHGELLLGNKGSYLVELAASWAIVMIVSGLFLWWPRGRGPAGVIYPRLSGRGRPLWRDLHAVVGFWVSLLALGFLISGLPWTVSWGAYLQAVRDAAAPTTAKRDWALGQENLLSQRAASDNATRHAGDPHAGHRAMTAVAGRVDYAPLDRMLPWVEALHLAGPVLIAPPAGPGKPWSAKSETPDRPLRTDLTLDASSGRVLSRQDFGSQAPLDRIVGYGVAAHEGQLFGLVNQILNLAVAIGLVALAISGAMMWWRRKPDAVLGAPPARARPPAASGFIVFLVILGLLLPMLGASMIVMLLVERLLLRRLPAARRWLGLRGPA